MKFKTEEPPKAKRKPISRAALEIAITEAVREADPQCKGLIGIIVERVVPVSGGANWAIKGVKYGKAVREPCATAILKCVEEKQLKFEISD